MEKEENNEILQQAEKSRGYIPPHARGRADYKKSFLKRFVASKLTRGAFTSRGYSAFKKESKEKAKAAYAVNAQFWDEVHAS